MDEYDRVRLLAELAESHCELNHGPGTSPQDYRAVNYIVLPLGYKENSIQEVSARELVIPVCGECLQALQQDDWTLLYCFGCCESRWVFRKLAKNRYRHHVLWMRGCPACTNEFSGLYFNEPLGIHGMYELRLAV